MNFWYLVVPLNNFAHMNNCPWVQGKSNKPPSPSRGTGPRSAVGNVSGYRCVSDCRSRGRQFDPGPVPYFRGD